LGHPPRLPGNKPPYQHTSAAKQEKNQTNAQLAGQIKKPEKIEKVAKCKDKNDFSVKIIYQNQEPRSNKKVFHFGIIAELLQSFAELLQNSDKTIAERLQNAK